MLLKNYEIKFLRNKNNIDGIINNAGIIQPFVKINELGYDAIERVMNVNFYGTVYITKTFLPHLLTRPDAHIVNVSSMGGFLPVPGQTIYGASKAAVKLLTEGLHSELSNTKVKVTVVFPGAVNTNITKNSGLNTPAQSSTQQQKSMKTLSAAKAAQIIIDGMEKNNYRVLVGSDAKFMDTIYRFNPAFCCRGARNQSSVPESLSWYWVACFIPDVVLPNICICVLSDSRQNAFNGYRQALVGTQVGWHCIGLSYCVV